MVQEMATIRDFMDEETLKFLPGNIRSANFIVLRQSKTIERTVGKAVVASFSTVLQVFDKNGTYIGEITNPAFIPDER
jgi:hypothetical protein